MPISPKYRHLTVEELTGLEKEFIEFLVLNGIVAEDWIKIKEKDHSKADDIITLFSDVVFEGILRKVKFLDYISKQEIRTFQCLEGKMILVGMTSAEVDHDFTDPGFIKKAASTPPEGIRVYTSEKKYTKPREEELFRMTEAGCSISDGKLFKVLSLSLV